MSELLQIHSTSGNPSQPNKQRLVLLVDDDEDILELSRCLILGLGWEVVAVKSAEEALAAFRSRPLQFAFALLDLSLPRMQGTELAARLREVRADLPILMATGHGDEMLAGDASLNLVGVLHKPYRFSDLEAAVKRATSHVDAA